MMIGLLLFIWICLDMSYNILVRKMGTVVSVVEIVMTAGFLAQQIAEAAMRAQI